ncbi:SAM-dependent methyltransferase, partial [Pseudomonas amygdali pv. morsprunorum]
TSNTEARSQDALFELGRVVLTHSVQSLLENNSLDVMQYLRRHATGDWGEISNDDWDSNQQALSAEGRLFSGYDIDAGDETRLWIITEVDRSVTTIMLPSDY